jgi:hypothetical protein
MSVNQPNVTDAKARRHGMKRLFRIFELSKNEQRVVLIVILILITIAFVEYNRRVHHSPSGPALETKSEASPPGVERIGDQ